MDAFRLSIHSTCSASSSQPRATSSYAVLMDGLLVCLARCRASAAFCRYMSARNDDIERENAYSCAVANQPNRNDRSSWLVFERPATKTPPSAAATTADGGGPTSRSVPGSRPSDVRMQLTPVRVGSLPDFGTNKDVAGNEITPPVL
jgi:hypothetical protein